MGRFTKGDRITSLDELMRQEFVFCNGKVLHLEWVLSWQLRTAFLYIQHGSLHKAIREEKKK